MWSDNEAQIDLLDSEHLVSAVTSVIRNDALTPVTIGVYGDWGSGKSTILQMVKNEVCEDENILCISFNGWQFEGYDDTKAALMGTILDEIAAQRDLNEKAKELLSKLLRRVDWFRLLGLAGRSILTFSTGLPSLALGDLGKTAKDAANSLKDTDPEEVQKLLKSAPDMSARQTVREFHSDFERLIDEANIETLVVFIDDLDRCLPDTVVETLEAIRLFLYAPHTAFVIGAAEELVQHAVDARFPEMRDTNLNVGRDYLEKLVQVPIRIPALGHEQTERYMNLLFMQLHLPDDRFTKVLEDLSEKKKSSRLDFGRAKEMLGDNFSDELATDLTLVDQTADVLTRGFSGNPRQTKRFLNTLLLRMTMASAQRLDLRRRVLAKLMLLEYFELEAFRELAEWQALQDGKPSELQMLEDNVRDQNKSSKAPHQPSNGEVVEEETDNELTETVNHWVENEWLSEWLSSEPLLADVNLAPYFFIARERLSSFTGATSRLGFAAQEALSALMSKSEAERRNGFKDLKQLQPAEISQIVQELLERIRRAEDMKMKEPPMAGLLLILDAYTERVQEVSRLFRGLDPSRVPIALPTRLVSITKDGPHEAPVKDLLSHWADCGVNQIESVASRALEQFS